MKNLRNILIILTAIPFLMACSEKSSSDDLQLIVSPEQIAIPWEGGSTTFAISSNCNWSITCDNPDLIVTPTSGNGDVTITVTAERNTMPTDVTTRLTIRATNGSVVRNVTVTQSGMLIQGGTLRVVNHANLIYFGGAVGEADSLEILANVPWKLYGPEWLEASLDGKKWTALSLSRATISGGNYISEPSVDVVLLRTKERNDSEYDQNESLTLKQDYDTGDNYEMQAIQLGAHRVAPNIETSMATSIATDWKIGAKVVEFYRTISNHELTADEYTPEKVLKWGKGAPDDVTAWGNLKENTQYYIATVGVDADGNWFSCNQVSYMTQSSQNQAIADLVDIRNEGNFWHIGYRMNSLCKMFYRWVTTNTKRFTQSDAMVGWFMYSDIRKQSAMISDGYVEFTVDVPFMYVTWAAGHDGNQLASVLSRFCSQDYNPAPSRTNHENEISEESASKEELMNAFIRIK